MHMNDKVVRSDGSQIGGKCSAALPLAVWALYLRSMNTLYFLECHSPKRHRIDIPAPTLTESIGNQPATTTDEKGAAFVCNQCGSVSSYSNLEIHSEVSPEPDPFRLHAYILFCIEPECDGRNCVAPRRIHEVWHNAKRTYPSVTSTWKNDGTAKCSAGHLLLWNREGGYSYRRCESPF